MRYFATKEEKCGAPLKSYLACLSKASQSYTQPRCELTLQTGRSLSTSVRGALCVTTLGEARVRTEDSCTITRDQPAATVSASRATVCQLFHGVGPRWRSG